MKKIRKLPLLLGIAGVCGFGPAGYAAETGEAAFEEIIVSARKRTERIIDVPMSMTAMSAEQIELTGANTLEGLQYQVANFSIDGEDSRSSNTIAIRGIANQEDSAGLDVGFGLSVDGVYMGRMLAVSQDLVDISRIEVLRGPQGTLQGKNTISGAISIVTKRPPSTFEGYAKVDLGNYDYIRTRVGIGGPLIAGVLNAKFDGFLVDGDGHVKNIDNGETYNTPDAHGLRGQLNFLPGDGVDILISADWTRINRKDGPSEAFGFDWMAAGFAPPIGAGPIVMAPKPYEVNIDGPSDEDIEATGVSAHVTVDVASSLALTSITAYREAKAVREFDRDYTNQPLFGDLNYEKQDQFSQELRLATTGSNTIDFTAGLFYMHQKVNESIDIFTLEGYVPIFPVGTGLYHETALKSDSYAAFGQVDYHVTDRLTIGAGIRYTRDEKEMTFLQTVPPGFPFRAQNVSGKYEKGAWSYNVTAKYEVAENANAYGLISRGYKAGGWNLGEVNFIVTDALIDPEYVTNYEVGLKGLYFDKRLALNLAAFYMKYTDQQVRDCGDASCLTEIIANAGSSTIKGFEVEGALKPVDSLSFDFAVGYSNAKFDEYSVGATDYSGKRLTYSPKWNGSAGITFTQGIGGLGEFMLHTGLTYRGDQFQDSANLRRKDGYTLMNARTGIRSEDNRWGVYLWAKNLTNKRYITAPAVLDLMGTRHERYGTPRKYGVSLEYNF
ncbi:TonB-dependent receptor [Sphingosinicella sp.]|uniref:TonB-dependent receptor n=1 Tax=Sphingosinicella sp. TaxID=1917971 RepID=UPI0035AF558F